MDNEWLIGPPAVYQDLGACNGWPVKLPLFDVPTRLKKNLKHTSGNLLGLLGAQEKEIGAALQTLLGRVRLHCLIFLIEYHLNSY